tara:strand:- start:42 stop:221 length:180 start_codon:yes stop_codon:yes gene_type:complete
MREYLIVQLKELIKRGQIHRDHANEVLEIYDEEAEDTSEQTAYDKAQQDIQILLIGECG